MELALVDDDSGESSDEGGFEVYGPSSAKVRGLEDEYISVPPPISMADPPHRENSTDMENHLPMRLPSPPGRPDNTAVGNHLPVPALLAGLSRQEGTDVVDNCVASPSIPGSPQENDYVAIPQPTQTAKVVPLKKPGGVPGIRPVKLPDLTPEGKVDALEMLMRKFTVSNNQSPRQLPPVTASNFQALVISTYHICYVFIFA